MGAAKDGAKNWWTRAPPDHETEYGDGGRQVVIGNWNGREIKIADVAEVMRTNKEREIITRINGKESVEIQIFKEADEISRAKDIPVKKGDLKDVDIDEASMDVVTLWHTLEHIQDLSVLNKISSVLKKNAVLIISVPNIESFQSRIFGKKWLHYNEPYHLHHFSPKSLALLLEKSGFSPFKTKHFCFTIKFPPLAS